MTQTLLTTIIDQKKILSYLSTIQATEHSQALSELARCIYFAILAVILPYVASEEQLLVARVLARGSSIEQAELLQDFPEDVRLSVSETVERILLSLK